MRKSSEKIIYKELSYRINGIIFTVRKELGRYKNEKQYADAIEKELQKREVSYVREKVIDDAGRSKVDFLIEEKVILEVKAKSFITKRDYFQVQRYLSDTGLQLGIIANMRQYNVLPKRVVNTKDKK